MAVLEPSTLQLRFIPLDSMLMHEEDDPYRVKRIARAISDDGRLRNPIIVARHGDQYVVLDGATRTSALREMGVRDALVQIVDYEAGTVRLSVWHHVIVGMTANRLLAELADVEELTLQPVDPAAARRMLETREIVGCICMYNGQEFAVLGEGDVNSQANALCRLVAVYRGKAEVHRTTEVDMPTLAQQYPDLSAVILFPRYQPDEIVQIAVRGARVPMGITRHIISGRALGLDVPLNMLTDTLSLEEKNSWLQNSIRQRLHANKIRLYQEPVFMFDE